VNALELHASEAGDSWLSALDELGLPLVVMPRCDGQIWVGDETSRGERLAALGSKLASQDERLVRALAHHPAPLLWVCEGSPETAAALCAPLARDPLRRPVAGLDLAVDVAPRSRKGADGERVWVAEIAGGPAGGTGTIATAAAEFLEQTRKGGFGGVILPPPAMRLFPKEWPKAWSGVASGLEARPWTAIERRASSRVGMEGLEAGRVAWIEVPYQQPVGLVAPSGGGGETWIWHTGAARLRQEGVSREITLRPASWRGLQRE
jgi:hypothetical protein